MGQTATFDDNTSVTLVRIVEDSRCPEGANCAWPGQVEAEFEICTATETGRAIVGSSVPVVARRSLTDGSTYSVITPFIFKKRSLRIIAVVPPRQTTSKIRESDYTFTVLVEHN